MQFLEKDLFWKMSFTISYFAKLLYSPFENNVGKKSILKLKLIP